jgi:hypothetical protein
MLSLLELRAAGETPWKSQPSREEALPPLLSFQIAHARLQQVTQGDDPEERAGTVTGDHGKPRQPSRGHSVDDDTQWFVWIRHHGMRLHDLRQLATVMAL